MFVVKAWQFRTQYIGQGELLAGPLAAWMFQQELANAALIWFIDHTSACTAMIRGCSPILDSSEMALVAALRLARINCSTWYEYIESEANPSDPLSRDGYEDISVARKITEGYWLQRHPAQIPWSDLVQVAAPLLSDHITALGDHAE